MIAAAGTCISCGGPIPGTSSCPHLLPRVALCLIDVLFGWQPQHRRVQVLLIG